MAATIFVLCVVGVTAVLIFIGLYVLNILTVLKQLLYLQTAEANTTATIYLFTLVTLFQMFKTNSRFAESTIFRMLLMS